MCSKFREILPREFSRENDFDIIRGMFQTPCSIVIDGKIPRKLALAKTKLREVARAFAKFSSARIAKPFREIAIILQDDEASAAVHLAINGVEGATDVITQPYDAMPGEAPGVYGELYVNVEQAFRVAPKRANWSPAKELILYVAHGIDHLSGADDHTEKGYKQMRKRELGWMKKVMLSLMLALATPFFAMSAEEEMTEKVDRAFYADAVAHFAFPQGGGDMRRQRSGAALRLGMNMTDAYAMEFEAASLEDQCGLAWRNVWHLNGFSCFDKLFGYERFDPFVVGGVRGWMRDGDVGPAAGIGALYYLTDSWALRLDGDVTLGLESETETIYSVSFGLQYAY